MLHPDQFKAIVADEEGELHRTFNRKTHINALISVENIQAGDLFRYKHQHEFPYQRATGAAIHDPDYPHEEPHYSIPIPRSFAPHMMKGERLKVIRERKKPRA